MDLHPFNVLVDDDGEPAAVIDWANTAAGDPELDRARTWSLLTLDPVARELRERAGWAALTDHWLQAGRMHTLFGLGTGVGLRIHALGPRRPACSNCGGMMQRTGSCYTCSSCGNNTGCG